MTNEQIVDEIRNGFSVTDNMARLYSANLPLIRQFIKPYTNYEPEEDILQTAYFGLHEAVKRYESSENVRFMTFAKFWIIREVQRYIENCGLIHTPPYIRKKIRDYEKCVQKFRMATGEEPTEAELSKIMKVSVAEIRKIKLYSNGAVSSLDEPLKDDENEKTTLSDMLRADSDTENEVVENLYGDYQKTVIWDVSRRFLDDLTFEILWRHYGEKQAISSIARELGETVSMTRTRKNNALRKLRSGKAWRELRERLEIIDAKVYNTGLTGFKEHGSSIVEHIAIRRIELESKSKKLLNR